MPLAALRLLIGIALTGCLSDPPPRSPDGAMGDSVDAFETVPRVRSWAVRDFHGRIHAPEQAPRRPVVHLETTVPLATDPEAIFLLDGSPTDALLRDLERAPLREATEARRLAATVDRRGTAILLTPAEPLRPKSTFTVAVASWALDEGGRRLDAAFVREVRIAEGPLAGAAVTDTWPADGTAGVPPALPMLAVRFDGDIDGLEGVSLIAANGEPIAARRQMVQCELVGWEGGRCVLLRPDENLAPSASHRIRVAETVRDATGAPLGPWSASFDTGSAWDVGGPSWLQPGCAPDEEERAPGCLLADDRSLTLRVSAHTPVRLWLAAASTASSAVASRGEATLRLQGLAVGTEHDLTLRAVDLAGSERTELLSVRIPADLASLSITEVRADARGPEPAQEYVEVANFGPAPVDFQGVTLSDHASRPGDSVSRPLLLPPGARALLVADGFDASGSTDAPVPPGVPLVRLGSSLGSGGLANRGEPLFLRDAMGRRLSAAPALPAPAAGACIVRTVGDPRTGDATSFAPDAEGGCTPGRPDRLP